MVLKSTSGTSASPKASLVAAARSQGLSIASRAPLTTTFHQLTRLSLSRSRQRAMDDAKSPTVSDAAIKHKVYTRVGLLGNYIYYGRTISLSLCNFWASVRLSPSDELVITPHLVHDLVHFNFLNHPVVGKPGPTVKRISGLSILDNNAVNLVSILMTTMLTSMARAYIVWSRLF